MLRHRSTKHWLLYLKKITRQVVNRPQHQSNLFVFKNSICFSVFFLKKFLHAYRVEVVSLLVGHRNPLCRNRRRLLLPFRRRKDDTPHLKLKLIYFF